MFNRYKIEKTFQFFRTLFGILVIVICLIFVFCYLKFFAAENGIRQRNTVRSLQHVVRKNGLRAYIDITKDTNPTITI